MLDFTKPIITRGGRPVRILCTDGPGDYPVVAFVGSLPVPQTFTLEGQHIAGKEGLDDLINEPERLILFGNVFANDAGTGIMSTVYFKDERGHKSRPPLGTVQLTLENGQLVDVALVGNVAPEELPLPA